MAFGTGAPRSRFSAVGIERPTSSTGQNAGAIPMEMSVAR